MVHYHVYSNQTKTVILRVVVDGIFIQLSYESETKFLVSERFVWPLPDMQVKMYESFKFQDHCCVWKIPFSTRELPHTLNIDSTLLTQITTKRDLHVVWRRERGVTIPNEAIQQYERALDKALGTIFQIQFSTSMAHAPSSTPAVHCVEVTFSHAKGQLRGLMTDPVNRQHIEVYGLPTPKTIVHQMGHALGLRHHAINDNDPGKSTGSGEGESVMTHSGASTQFLADELLFLALGPRAWVDPGYCGILSACTCYYDNPNCTRQETCKYCEVKKTKKQRKQPQCTIQ